MRELNDLLERATAAINWSFFRVNIAGGNSIFRERVYTYELYHQLRTVWPEESSYTLNGELDKSGHPKLKHVLSSRVKPDLLVHQPGSMYGNFAIIEIKSAKAGAAGIKKDVKTLSEFVRKVDYRRAIYFSTAMKSPIGSWISGYPYAGDQHGACGSRSPGLVQRRGRRRN